MSELWKGYPNLGHTNLTLKKADDFLLEWILPAAPHKKWFIGSLPLQNTHICVCGLSRSKHKDMGFSRRGKYMIKS